MTNSRTTRKALVSSALTVLLCMAMLIGTTFAWFTDTASTAVNKIQAGTLNIALEMKDGENWVDAEGKTLEFKKAASAPTDEEVLWEPGCTYKLPEVRLINKGNLALKYKIVLSGIKGDAKLNDAIEWTIGGLDLDTEGTLLAGATSDALTIEGHMKEDAGNEYQGLSIDGIAITVYATQYTYEHDSIDDLYDKDSTYPAEIIAEIKDAKLTKETVADEKSGENVEVFSYANSDSTAKVSVPAKGVSPDATPVVSIKPTEADATASTTISAEGKDAIAYDINITNLNGETKATIEIYIGKGLTGVEVFHNSSAMSADDYSYNATTGYLTIKSATFSPFTIAYDATLAKYPTITTGATLNEVFADANIDFGYGSTSTESVTLDGRGVAVVSDWTDAWVNSDTTIKGVTFKNGAVFSVKTNNVTITLENCTFYACDQSKLTYTGNNSLTNSGAGMCLNLEKSSYSGVKFIVKNCTFVGENNNTLPVDGPRYKADGTQDGTKKRGHAIALDAICGGGTGTLDSLLIEGCVINGVRGNAIQLYGNTGDITIKDTKINSWAMNNSGVGFAIRGDYPSSGRTLTITNVYFGLDEQSGNTEFGHVKVGSFSGNTDGTETAGTYSK